MSTFARHVSLLAALEARGRRRSLAPRSGLDFSSNDYLGLAESPQLRAAAEAALARGVPVGSGGSRLLRGNHSEHEALEAEAADFFGTEAALYMGGGFQANLALFSTLPGAEDLILHDALIHASVHEGMRLSRAERRAFEHNDIVAARRAVADWRAAGGSGIVWLAVESVYSMDGDFAPLRLLAEFARETGAVLVIDEAHATGVFGHEGRGLAHDLEGAELVMLHTCGKALGVSGALVCGARVLIETLVNRARPFIFATAPSPLDAALVRASLQTLRELPSLQAMARARMEHAHAEAARLCGLEGLQSQILPVIIGDDGATMECAAALQQAGFDVRGIRPPTVPRGTSRLRISLTGNISDENVTALFETLAYIQEVAD